MDFDDHHHRDIHHLHHCEIHHHDDDDSEEEEEEGSDELMLNNNSHNVVTPNNSNNSTPITNNINRNSDNIAVNSNNNSSALNINNITAMNNSRARMVEALSQVQIHQHHQIDTGVIISNSISKQTRFRECQKNHALHVMGHAVDGCGEFMPSGPEGSMEALRCAACNCHRNFHRKEEPGDATVLFPHQAAPFGSYYRTTHHPAGGFLALAPPPRLALPSSSGGGAGGSQSGQEEDVTNLGVNGTGMTTTMVVGSGSARCGSGSERKRFRTKFTAEQKEAMRAMAKEIGWKISKSEEEAVQQFCQRSAVKRHVFKVWMHNNKHTLGKMSCNNNNNNNSVAPGSDPRLSQSQ